MGSPLTTLTTSSTGPMLISVTSSMCTYQELIMPITLSYKWRQTCYFVMLSSCFRFSDLEGQHRHTVYDGNLPHPFALTVFEDTVYWTDWNTRTVEKGNKYDGSGRQVLVNTTHRPFDLHVCHPYRQPFGKLISSTFWPKTFAHNMLCLTWWQVLTWN